MKDDQSTEKIVTRGAAGSVVATDLERKPARVTLDFATWRAHLAAPGSRFEATPLTWPRIIRFDAVGRAAGTPQAERRTA